MDLVEFLKLPTLWGRPIPGMYRSTLNRIANGARTPSVEIATRIARHSGRDIHVTASSLTPLPLPCQRGASPRSPEQVVPLFQCATGELIGNYTGNFVHHRTGQGGTLLLAMMSAIACGGGWETWAVLPKGEVHYFATASRLNTGSEVALILDAAKAVEREERRPVPLLLTVDLVNQIAQNESNPANIADALLLIGRRGARYNVFLNIAATRPVLALESIPMAEVELGGNPVHRDPADSLTARVDGQLCRRPTLFLDFLCFGDTTDLDYRRYLAYAGATIKHNPDAA